MNTEHKFVFYYFDNDVEAKKRIPNTFVLSA